MDELRIAKEKIKDLEEKQKKDEKTMKSQFDHMMRLQEKCKELQAQALGTATTTQKKAKPLPGVEDKDKIIEELKDKLLQAEKNKEILQKANESEIKSAKLTKARADA